MHQAANHRGQAGPITQWHTVQQSQTSTWEPAHPRSYCAARVLNQHRALLAPALNTEGCWPRSRHKSLLSPHLEARVLGHHKALLHRLHGVASVGVARHVLVDALHVGVEADAHLCTAEGVALHRRLSPTSFSTL